MKNIFWQFFASPFFVASPQRGSGGPAGTPGDTDATARPVPCPGRHTRLFSEDILLCKLVPVAAVQQPPLLRCPLEQLHLVDTPKTVRFVLEHPVVTWKLPFMEETLLKVKYSETSFNCTTPESAEIRVVP